MTGLSRLVVASPVMFRQDLFCRCWFRLSHKKVTDIDVSGVTVPCIETLGAFGFSYTCQSTCSYYTYTYIMAGRDVAVGSKQYSRKKTTFWQG